MEKNRWRHASALFLRTRYDGSLAPPLQKFNLGYLTEDGGRRLFSAIARACWAQATSADLGQELQGAFKAAGDAAGRLATSGGALSERDLKELLTLPVAGGVGVAKEKDIATPDSPSCGGTLATLARLLAQKGASTAVRISAREARRRASASTLMEVGPPDPPGRALRALGAASTEWLCREVYHHGLLHCEGRGAFEFCRERGALPAMAGLPRAAAGSDAEQDGWGPPDGWGGVQRGAAAASAAHTAVAPCTPSTVRSSPVSRARGDTREDLANTTPIVSRVVECSTPVPPGTLRFERVPASDEEENADVFDAVAPLEFWAQEAPGDDSPRPAKRARLAEVEDVAWAACFAELAAEHATMRVGMQMDGIYGSPCHGPPSVSSAGAPNLADILRDLEALEDAIFPDLEVRELFDEAMGAGRHVREPGSPEEFLVNIPLQFPPQSELFSDM